MDTRYVVIMGGATVGEDAVASISPISHTACRDGHAPPTNEYSLSHRIGCSFGP